MRVITIKQVEYFEVEIDDDTLTDEEAMKQALQDGDAWVSTGYLDVCVPHFERDGRIIEVVDV